MSYETSFKKVGLLLTEWNDNKVLTSKSQKAYWHREFKFMYIEETDMIPLITLVKLSF